MRNWILTFLVATLFFAACGRMPQDLPAPPPEEVVQRSHINLPGRSDDLPYSNAVMVGNTLYLAGSIGVDPETGAPPATIQEEVTIVMEGMKTRLEMVGMTMDHVVSVQVFCPDLSLYEEFNAVYRTYFTEKFPARAFIGSGPLLRGGHFEIMATAVKP